MDLVRCRSISVFLKLTNIKFLILSIFLVIPFAYPKEFLSGKTQQFARCPSPGLNAFSGRWRLIFSDEFNSVGNFDAKKWSHSPRWSPAWAKYLTSAPDYAFVNGTSLVLKMDDHVIPEDRIPYHSGGIQTSTKFSLTYGKVEVRARFKKGKGSWPAIWMMPEIPVSYGDWPNSGEIDIMEHVNYESDVHQTIHNGRVTDADGGSLATHAARYNQTDFNTYGIVWSPESIQFYVNSVLHYTYKKAVNEDFKQWPFDRPFYLILNQSGGAGWPGAIADADLPFIMEVDWVRVYKKAVL